MAFRVSGGELAAAIKALPDIIALSGLSLLGYGLWLYEPWISYAVCGAVLLVGGCYLSIPARRAE